MLILASASPRRAYLLSMIGLDYRVVCPGCDETLQTGTAPDEAVRLLSVRKAEWTAKHSDSLGLTEEDTIIAADTLVCLGGQLMGKPRNGHDAYTMLRNLSGRVHEVYTGLAVYQHGTMNAATQRTKVHFRELTDDEILAYIATGIPLDKAGAYGIQDRGALFVSSIEGDFYSVMGLPVCLLGQMIRNIYEVGTAK